MANLNDVLQALVNLTSKISTKLASKADTDHNHNDEYYTEGEIDSKVNTLNSSINNKADKTYVDNAVANVDIDGVVKTSDVVEGVVDIDTTYVTHAELDDVLGDFNEDVIPYIEDVEAVAYGNKADIEETMTVAYANKNKIGEIELATTDKTLTGAINELFQSANNGKQLIASAIGEPLNAEDTFSAMSTDINSLLSTFKTNMMNNGVTVESGDKFKSLIDKIATMVEEGSKSVQIKTGLVSSGGIKSKSFSIMNSDYEDSHYIVISDLGFTPSIILANAWGGTGYTNDYFAILNNMSSKQYYNPSVKAGLSAINSAGGGAVTTFIANNKVFIDDNTIHLPLSTIVNYGNQVEWIAIGVGEEDTTFRDSLADILENKGVDVTEEDDMASLIIKVDDMNSGLNIISATELPATGVENQICIITDEPSIINVSNLESGEGSTVNTIFCYIGGNSNTTLSNSITFIDNNMTQEYNFNAIRQYDTKLYSYIYQNSNWNLFTGGEFIILKNAGYHSHATKNNIVFSQTLESNGLYLFGSATAGGQGSLLNKQIDLTDYTKLEISGTGSLTYGNLYFVYSSSKTGNITNLNSVSYYDCTLSTTIDISSINGLQYIGFFVNGTSSLYGTTAYIQNVKLY